MPPPQILWDVLCLGEALIEFRQEPDGSYIRGLSGDASNVALAVARMGGTAAIAGRIGSDDFGDQLIRIWDQAGVDRSLIYRDPSAATGHCFLHRANKGFAAHCHQQGTAMSAVVRGDIDHEAIAQARVLHLSGATLALSASMREAAEEMMDIARNTGVRISFDPHCAQAEAQSIDTLDSHQFALTQADVVYLTAEDAVRLLGQDRPTLALDKALAMGPQIVVLRLGADGVWIATQNGRSHIPAHPATRVEPSGQREAFIGTFLSGLTAGNDMVITTERAVQAAALAGSRAGGAASIPALPDLVDG